MPGTDAELASAAQRIFERQGIKFVLGARVTGAKAQGDKAIVTWQDKSGETKSIEVDRVLVSTGRKPYTDGLGVKEIGVALDNRGRITVDAHYQTNVPGIYAIGDVIPGAMLAHKASEEGVVAVEQSALAAQGGGADLVGLRFAAAFPAAQVRDLGGVKGGG
jgi:dihydrolipoamide dehydrogenase